MNKEEEGWYWYGVSLGLGVAVIIADHNGGISNRARAAVNEQKARIDNRDKDRAAEAGMAEYKSWIDAWPASVEIASWLQPAK